MRVLVHPDGRLEAGGLMFRCALGKGGVAAAKREGDGATPVGCFAFRRVLYRPDRGGPPATGLPIAALAESDGWCDDPADPAYNQPVRLPFAPSHERLWRDDHLYDVIVVIGHNDDPPVPFLGSAVFMHLARPDWTATEGCIALSRPDLETLLARLAPGDEIEVLAPAS
jgi:L,D-peptidoglycan transpeptidase YkuD (ErfK/YbiS/YcfS/YnhG family)